MGGAEAKIIVRLLETLNEGQPAKEGAKVAVISSFRSVASHSAPPCHPSLPLVRLHTPPSTPPSPILHPSTPLCSAVIALRTAAEIYYYFYPPSPPSDCRPFETPSSTSSRVPYQFPPILPYCEQSTHSKQVSIIRAKQTVRHEPASNTHTIQCLFIFFLQIKATEPLRA